MGEIETQLAQAEFELVVRDNEINQQIAALQERQLLIRMQLQNIRQKREPTTVKEEAVPLEEPQAEEQPKPKPAPKVNPMLFGKK